MPTTPVYIACFTGAELLDIAGPISVFSTATSLLRRKSGYDVRLVADRAGPVVTSSGVTLTAEQALGSVRGTIDTLIIPGGLQGALDGAAPLVPVVGRLAPRVRSLGSVSVESFSMLRAGSIYV